MLQKKWKGQAPIALAQARSLAVRRFEVLKNAHVYLENMPKGEMYEKILGPFWWLSWRIILE